jgi:hypothetical protein
MQQVTKFCEVAFDGIVSNLEAFKRAQGRRISSKLKVDCRLLNLIMKEIEECCLMVLFEKKNR